MSGSAIWSPSSSTGSFELVEHETSHTTAEVLDDSGSDVGSSVSVDVPQNRGCNHLGEALEDLASSSADEHDFVLVPPGSTILSDSALSSVHVPHAQPHMDSRRGVGPDDHRSTLELSSEPGGSGAHGALSDSQLPSSSLSIIVEDRAGVIAQSSPHPVLAISLGPERSQHDHVPGHTLPSSSTLAPHIYLRDKAFPMGTFLKSLRRHEKSRCNHISRRNTVAINLRQAEADLTAAAGQVSLASVHKLQAAVEKHKEELARAEKDLANAAAATEQARLRVVSPTLDDIQALLQRRVTDETKHREALWRKLDRIRSLKAAASEDHAESRATPVDSDEKKHTRKKLKALSALSTVQLDALAEESTGILAAVEKRLELAQSQTESLRAGICTPFMVHKAVADLATIAPTGIMSVSVNGVLLNVEGGSTPLKTVSVESSTTAAPQSAQDSMKAPVYDDSDDDLYEDAVQDIDHAHDELLRFPVAPGDSTHSVTVVHSLQAFEGINSGTADEFPDQPRQSYASNHSLPSTHAEPVVTSAASLRRGQWASALILPRRICKAERKERNISGDHSALLAKLARATKHLSEAKTDLARETRQKKLTKVTADLRDKRGILEAVRDLLTMLKRMSPVPEIVARQLQSRDDLTTNLERAERSMGDASITSGAKLALEASARKTRVKLTKLGAILETTLVPAPPSACIDCSVSDLPP